MASGVLRLSVGVLAAVAVLGALSALYVAITPAADQTPLVDRSWADAVAQDPELDSRLMAAGFSEPQAQLVYDLAAEKLAPLVEELLGEVESQRQIDRLEQHFGGADAWRQTACQLKGWAAAHLSSDVAVALSSSFDGILALHKMMQASEPELLSGGDPGADSGGRRDRPASPGRATY